MPKLYHGPENQFFNVSYIYPDESKTASYNVVVRADSVIGAIRETEQWTAFENAEIVEVALLPDLQGVIA